MTKEKLKLGQAGEKAAVAFLEQNGYTILERNFKNHFGEIDIIAREKDVVCFIEVKTRRSDAFGSPFEAVTPQKQRKIIHVALSYLKSRGSAEANARFDVAAVFLNEEEEFCVDLIRNAFDVC